MRLISMAVPSLQWRFDLRAVGSCIVPAVSCLKAFCISERRPGATMGDQQPPSWTLALQLERALRGSAKKQMGFWSSSTRALRAALLQAYEAVLFEDYTFAQANEVEQQLWKTVWYKPIEEFRTRIKLASQVSQRGVAMAGATPEEAAQQLIKTSAAFAKFLADAAAAYRSLVTRLQAAFGSVGVQLQGGEGVAEVQPGTVQQAHDCRASVHRCLVYLGDLSRYRSQVLGLELGQHGIEQRAAVAHYSQAARVLPASGNPYNQLAVMAYSARNDLLSVYWYYRALGAPLPFVTARDNLLVLFEQSRAKYAQLQLGRPTAEGTASWHEVATRYVRLLGALYDRINLECAADVRAGAAAALRAALGSPTSAGVLTSADPAASPPLQLVVCLVFTCHSLLQVTRTPGKPAGAAERVDIAQRPLLRRLSITALLEVAAALASAVPGTGPGSAAVDSGAAVLDTPPAVFAALHVVAAWLGGGGSTTLSAVVTAPLEGGVRAGEAGSRLGNAPGQPGPSPLKQDPLDEPGAAWQEVVARAAWWRAAGRLARVLAASLPYLPGPSPSAVALMAACAERPQGWGKAAGEDLLASAAVVQWPPPEVEHLAGFVPLSTAWAHPPLGLGLGRNNTDGGGEPPQQSATLRALLLLVWLRRMAIQLSKVVGSTRALLSSVVSDVSLRNLEAAQAEFVAVLDSLACAPDGNGSAVPALAVPGLQPAACVHANGDLPSGQEAEMEGDEEILYRPSPHHVPSGSVGAQGLSEAAAAPPLSISPPLPTVTPSAALLQRAGHSTSGATLSALAPALPVGPAAVPPTSKPTLTAGTLASASALAAARAAAMAAAAHAGSKAAGAPPVAPLWQPPSGSVAPMLAYTPAGAEQAMPTPSRFCSSAQDTAAASAAFVLGSPSPPSHQWPQEQRTFVSSHQALPGLQQQQHAPVQQVGGFTFVELLQAQQQQHLHRHLKLPDSL